MKAAAKSTSDRRAWRSTALTLLVSLWCTLLLNGTFWSEVRAVKGDSFRDLAFLASLFVVVTLYVNLLLSLFAFRWIGRPWLALVLLVAAAVSHFTSTFGARLDSKMMRSVFETDARESAELIGWGLVLRVALLGALPALALFAPRFEFGTLRQELAAKLRVAALTLLCAVPIAALFYPDYASLMRNHRELRHVFVPANFLSGTYGYWKSRWRHRAPLRPIGTDAHRALADAGARPQLLLLVIGETARSANFSLGGYPRPTNPQLARREVVYFTQVQAAGTSTAESLPRMFADHGSAEERAGEEESLLDVLTHAGVGVLWRDNDSGCKGVCERVEYENLARLRDPLLCPSGECYDEILLQGLQQRLDATARDQVIVLHMHGSHGPGYHLRYPPAFGVFQPACSTLELEHCSHEELLNAYDNTIVYTDHVLARAIELLERNRERFDCGLLYVSDHGESLGEHGIFLHGLPSWMAPDEQTRVPMILWLSEGLRRRRGVDLEELAARRDRPLSHDHLFHTVLGLLGVETRVYRPELDFTRPLTHD